jgi:hypothetical protein
MANLDVKLPYIDLKEAAAKVADAHDAVKAQIEQHAADAAAKRQEARDGLHALRLSQGNTYRGGELQ